MLPFEYPYAEDDAVPEDEVGSIVSRVSAPTKASQGRGAVGGFPPCWKAEPDVDHVRRQSPALPLVSGLERTPTVAAIVDRLSKPRRPPTATPTPTPTPTPGMIAPSQSAGRN